MVPDEIDMLEHVLNRLEQDLSYDGVLLATIH